MKSATSLAVLITALIVACSPSADPPATEQDIVVEPGDEVTLYTVGSEEGDSTTLGPDGRAAYIVTDSLGVQRVSIRTSGIDWPTLNRAVAAGQRSGN